tara:strand:+ start:242 stop:778 length:537 start_codon:yes stop_codon:yes gene_type:complete
MLIEDIIQGLMGIPNDNVIRMMRGGLNRSRGGNQLPHSTTSRTANSIKADRPVVNGIGLTWDFKANDSALRLNNGGSKFKRKTTDVPYGQFNSPGGESQYIKALINWCKRKYGLDDMMAKKMAFKVAQAASNRGTVVKNAGWFNEIEKRVFNQIINDIKSIIMININKTINQELKINK